MLVPSGSYEQHGPHLPLATDTLIATALARLVAERLEPAVIVTPTVAPGLSWHHLGFPGTVDLGEEGFRAIHDAYVAMAAGLDIRHVFLISSHGGNFAFIGRYADESFGDVSVHAFAEFAEYVEAMREGGQRAGLALAETDVHAGKLETSQALHLFPDDVLEFEGLVGYVAAEDGWLDTLFADGVHALSDIGVLGEPHGATAEAGEQIMLALAERIAGWARALLSA